VKSFVSSILLVFLLPLISLAQSNYKPGYVVTTKGDTLRGFIDQRSWDTNPEYIRFKASKDGETQKFTPEEITFFSVGKSDAYAKYEGPITMDSASDLHVNNFRDTSYKIAVVFLKVLKKGKNVCLYAYSDNLKTRYFVSEQPAFKPTELIYRLYFAELSISTAVANTGRTVNENTYMKQLYQLALKYNALSTLLQRDIEDLSYEEYRIGKVITQINKGNL